MASSGRLFAGSSGFSYPSWRPDFYPASTKPSDFLGLYADLLPAVELNSSFYRLPSEQLFERWATATPDGFRFAVKMPRSISLFGRLDQVGTFCERVRTLGDRLGPVLARLADGRPRDDGFIRLLLDSLSPGAQLALDARDPSWAEGDRMLESAGAVRVNKLEGDAPFRYLRLRDPPYDDDELGRIAAELAPILAGGIDVFCFFKHEDEPTAPRYASRLLELVG